MKRVAISLRSDSQSRIAREFEGEHDNSAVPHSLSSEYLVSSTTTRGGLDQKLALVQR